MNDIKVPPFTDGLKEIIEATEKHKEKCDKIRTNVNKWGRKNICDVDDDVDVLTNEEWLRSATFEEMAGAIYEWHSAGYTSGRVGLGLNPVTEVVEWLKQPHH